jgi:hypothetical protein
MKIRVPSRVGGAVICAGLLAPACSQPSSGPQSALAPAAPASALSTRAPDAAAVFPLVHGSFTIENAGGDGIAGTYTGTSTFGGGGSQESSLALQVTAGSGAFAGATGSLVLTGQGAFADEGTFVLGGSGEVAHQDGKRAVLILRLRGSSTAGCTASSQIAITQIADGTLGRIGRVTATLNHTVLNTGCSS